MPTKMKSMSKMNKKELYELCKNQREQIQSHQMDMNELKEGEGKAYDYIIELNKLREEITYHKNYQESCETKIKELEEEKNSKVKLLCKWGENDIKMEKLLDNELWAPYGCLGNYEKLVSVFQDYKLIKSKNTKLRKANKDFAEVVKSYEETMKTQKMENNKLIHKLYKFDPETGEMKGTIIDSYKTIKYKQWRHTNLQEQIAYECNDDDSMFDLGYYIKFLEKKS